MRKGKYNFELMLYPVCGFIFAALKMPVVCILIFLAATFIEKDRWTQRQSLCAFFLSLVPAIFSAVSAVLRYLPGFFVFDIVRVGFGIFDAVVYVGVLIFCVIGIVRVIKEEEADLIFFSDLACMAFGEKRADFKKED